mgnify:CR=1 FL=1
MLPYQTIPQKEDGIAIVGIGGAGANILQCFAGSSANNVRLYTLSLDERVGRSCGSNVEFVQLGGGLNHGLGSGGDPSVGSQAAYESRAEIEKMFEGARLLVLVAGLGGGTGSGAAPVLARMAREAGLFLVSVLVMPFAFEGKRRREQAEGALEEVARLSDIVFCFENDYMEELFRNRPGARAVFEEVDRMLARATASVPMLASSPGFINLGLDELAVALENQDSRCIFGSGSGYGPERAVAAARAALESPLVAYHGALKFARTVVVHIAGGDSMSITEIKTAMETVRTALADEEVNIFFGTTVKPHLGDEIRVTLIASINAAEFKFALENMPEPEPEEQPAIEEEAQDFDDEPADELFEEEPEEVPASSVGQEEPGYELPADEQPLFSEEVEEEYYVDEEEEHVAPVEDAVPSFNRQPAMHQPELMPDMVQREDDVPAPHEGGNYASTVGAGRFAALHRRRPQPAQDDDLDTPPTLSFNDLRDMFSR